MTMPGIRLAFLYPDLMNIYGDRGNVIALTQRCRWRGLEIAVSELGLACAPDPDDFDLYFFGGGQDREQLTVAEDLLRYKAAALRAAAARGAAVLAICGGYQLLANYYQPFNAQRLDGVGLFDAWTEASATRMIGNVAIELDAALAAEAGQVRSTVVGFENHSGKTRLGPGCRPLGRVMRGFGNNGEDGCEGAIQGHAIGCYLHGSLLPKNPHLADLLIRWALEHRYGASAPALAPLADALEWQAHAAALCRKKSAFSRREGA